MYHRFGHLKEKPLVKKGEWVKRGQMIGRVGNTGNSTAPHLHYDIFANKPERWTYYSKGLSLHEVKEIWKDPEDYIDWTNNLPVPFTHEGWSYLQWTGNLYHTGTDGNHGSAWSDLGNPVLSTVDGQVEHARFYKDWGWLLIIREDMQKNPNLIQQKDRPEIYYYNGEKKFHIPDWYTFTHLRYALEEVTQIDDASSIPNGDPFPSLDPDYQHIPPSPEPEEKPETGGDKQKWQYEYMEQGGTGMCTALAVSNAYYGLTGVRLSPLGLYVGGNQFFEDDKDKHKGLSPRSAFRFGKEYGVPLETELPFGEPWGEDHYTKYERGMEYINENLEGSDWHKFTDLSVTLDNVKEVLDTVSPVVAIITFNDGWENGAEGHNGGNDHTLCLLDYKGDHFIAIDSLRKSGDDDGIRHIHKSIIDELRGIKKL